MIGKENIFVAAFSDALEKMAFMTIMSSNEYRQPISSKMTLVKISFEGPKSGSIEVLAGINFCKALAENIGALDDPDESICHDALKEICNITCGILISLISRPKTDSFEISIPIAKSIDQQVKWDDFIKDVNCRILSIEGYPVAAKLIINDEQKKPIDIEGDIMKTKDFSGIRNNSELPSPLEITVPVDVGDLLGDYIDSTKTLLEELEVAAIAYEAGHSVDDTTAMIRRLLHKLKGESSVLGIDDICELCHQAEFAFEELNPDKRTEMLLRFKDWLSTTVEIWQDNPLKKYDYSN